MKNKLKLGKGINKLNQLQIKEAKVIWKIID